MTQKTNFSIGDKVLVSSPPEKFTGKVIRCHGEVVAVDNESFEILYTDGDKIGERYWHEEFEYIVYPEFATLKLL